MFIAYAADSPGAGELTRIANERTRIAGEIRLLFAQQALPSCTSRNRKRIRKQLRRLTQLRDCLDDKIAELRRREADIYHGAGSPASSSSRPPPAGSPASSSRPHPAGSPASSSRETGVVRHVDTIDSDILDSTIGEPSALEEKKPSEIPGKYWRPKFVGTIIFARRQAEREFAERQAQLLQARGQRTYASKDEIVHNAKKWMSEEVMVAFRRFIESEDDLKDIEYEFEKLLHQCFNVEHYFKICHHFNFSVKIKKCVSDDWTQMTFFAEVISILQKKHYVCSPLPLDPNEDGECYACRNQGMYELRHPSADIFDCGNEDATIPYYEDCDSDEAQPAVGWSESDDDMS